ncbi:HSP70-domain-containing protein [Backusella circina FSU 941]|nr:HSP70-domain-containing protein [Backusella circina FSU 941]
MNRRWLCLIALIFLPIYHAAVMSIDYGVEWFKVGLIKPGMPLDVALNKDSKRKTQSVVTIRNHERIFGSDSISLAARFPHLTYFNLKNIIGKTFDDEHCQAFRKRYTNEMKEDPIRHTPLFVHDENQLSVEELIAYQFQNARLQASNTAGENVKDVVITVPPFANQYERQAILDAAELAGLNVLSLMHDETAVALNYAVNRELSKTPENHMFYDMGSGSTVASIVTFVETSEGVPQIEVKGVGYDRTLGGHEFDARLLHHLAQGFIKINKADITTSVNAMTRLLKEANRVKQILSANTETAASVENIHQGLDFKMKVSRAELESLCADLITRVKIPMEIALKNANMTVDDIQSVVLVGGNVRIPSVQNELIKLVGAQKIAKNVNGDEAAVLGAAFRGASLSTQFRLTKNIAIKDITVFPIDIIYKADAIGDEVHTTLFDQFGSIGERKTLQFAHDNDIEFNIMYGEDAGNGITDIAKVKITGVKEVIKKHADDLKSQKMHVVFEMSNSGMFSVPEAYFEIPKRSFKDKVKSFFGKDKKDTKVESTEPDAEQNESTTETNDNKNDTATEKEQEETLTFIKIPLIIEYTQTGLLPLTPERKAEAKKRIAQLDLGDKMQKEREESRNGLESFVYRVQEFLYEDDIPKVVTEKDLEDFRIKLSETSEWLYGDGESANTAEYTRRLNELQKIEQGIQFRLNEFINRDKNINDVASAVQSARSFIDIVKQDPEQFITQDDINTILELADSTEKWMAEKVDAQNKLADTDEPVIVSSQVVERTSVLKDHLVTLIERIKVEKSAKEVKSTQNTEQNDQQQEQQNQSNTEETSESEQKWSSSQPEDESHHTHDEL